MATLNKKILGALTGSVGDVVFKSRKGKTYIASKPASYDLRMDEKSVHLRSKFGFCTSLFSAMGKVFWFKYLWNNPDIPGDSIINKLFIANYNRVPPDLNFSNILLTPMEGQFAPVLTKVESINFNITFAFEPLGSGIINEVQNKVSLQGVMSLENPYESTGKPIKFIPVSSEIIISEPNQPITFECLIMPKDQPFYNDYRVRKFLVNILVRDTKDVPLISSFNIIGNLNLPEEK